MTVRLARVGDVATQVRGVSYGKEDASDSARPGYLPVLRAGNITEHGLVFDNLVFVPAARVASRQRIRRHDMVIAASSGSLDVVGKAARALTDFDGGFGAFCKVLRPGADVDPGYFAQFFKTGTYRRRVSALAAGANINNLRNEHLDDMLLPLPSLAEQRRIADILDRADALRAKRRAALALLDTLPQSIFIDMFSDPAKDGQKEWRCVGDLLESATYGTSEKASSSGSMPVLRMNNVTPNGQMNLSDLKFMDLSEDDLERYTVKAGDLLFNRTNSPDFVGKTAVFGESTPMAYAGYLIRLRTNTLATPEYLNAFLNGRYGKAKLRGMCKSIIGMANINATEVKAMRIPVPAISLQQQFASRIAAVDKLKAAHRASLAQLDALFASLQHRAFRAEL